MHAPVPLPPVTRTACPYCGVGCGVSARPDGIGGAITTGDPDHPANFGRLCSKGFALEETLGLNGRLLRPMLRRADGSHARVDWDTALVRRRRWLPPRGRTRRTECGRVLSLRAASDRRLLRRQQADERLPRLGQRRHQFAAVHGLDRGRPPPRLRRGCRARLLRGPRRGEPPRFGRLEHRLVSSGAVPAHDQEPARTRRQDRGDRSAPDGNRRRGRPVSFDCAGHRHRTVFRPAGPSRGCRRARPSLYRDAHGGLRRSARARPADRARRSGNRGRDRPRRRRRRALLPAVPRQREGCHLLLAGREPVGPGHRQGQRHHQLPSRHWADRHGPAWDRSR